MPKDFKYDVIQLIHSVKERPCIWDKSLESHKDRIERRAAWEEVFSILEPRYIEMSPTKKKTTGDHILSKWTNMRDTFVKSLKTKFGKPKKKYMLYHQLKFLLKVLPTASEHSENNEEGGYSDTECNEDSMSVKYEKNIEEGDFSNTECNEESITPVKHENNVEKESSRGKYNNRKRRVRDLGDEIINRIPKRPAKEHDKNDLDFVDIAVEDENDPRIMNEDEAFFASLLPSVVRYTEEERLEFRIEVLALMRRIKENRNWIIGS